MSSDAELIDLILAGHTDSFAVLLKRYERLARAVALRYVRDRHVADDVVQEAFVAAFKGLASLRDRSSFGGWLTGIVRRRGVTAMEKQRRGMPTSDGIESHACPSDSGPATQGSVELLELIDQLPDQEGIVISLRHFEGYSFREIAEITGRPIGTVTKQLSRARQRLQGWLTERNVEHERIHKS